MQEKKLSGPTLAVTALLSFLIPCAALTMVFYLAGVYPFGESSLLFSANGEWFENVAAVHKAILGEGSLFYGFDSSLGSDFYSRFASGACSPFLFITVFFKQSALREALTFVMCIKAGCAGLFTFLMLSALSKKQPMLALPFAVAYGSGSLFALGFLAPQYTDCAVFLPLVGAGIAMLVGSGSLLVLYIGLVMFFMSCSTLWPCCIIFSVIALIWIRQQRARNIATMLSQMSLLLLTTALAVGATMLLTIPALSGNMQAGRAVTALSDIDTASPASLLAGFFPGSGIAEGQAALICTGALTVVMLPIYCLNKTYQPKERLVSLVTVAVIILSMLLPPLGWVMLGFSQPTGTVVASSFAASLLMCMAAARAVMRSDKLRVGTVIAAWLSSLAVYLLAIIFGFGKTFAIESIIFTIVFMTIYAAIILISVSKRAVGTGFCILLTACIVCEAVFGGTLSIISMKKSLPLEPYQTQAQSEALDAICENTIAANESGAGGFFRVRGVNTGSLNDIGEESTSSTKQSRLLLDVMGISGENGFTRFTDALFGVRYTIGQTEPGSTAAAIGTDGVNTVFFNPEALPLCFAASDDVLELTEFSSDPFTAQNQLATAICGAQRDLFCETGYISSGNGVSFVETLEGVELTRSAEQGSVSFAVTVPCDGVLYMYMKCDTGFEETVSVNGSPVRTQPLDSIVSLGTFRRGDTVYVDVTVHSERAVLEALSFAALDESLFGASMSQLAASGAQYIKAEGNKVSATVTLSEGQVLMTTIPWQQGWSCRLDRESGTEIACAAGSLVALELPVGTHNFELGYTPSDFTQSVIVSVILALLGAVLVIVAQIRRRGKRLPDGSYAPNVDLPDDFADAANIFPAREVDPSMQPQFDSFEQRQNQFADPEPQYYDDGFEDMHAEQYGEFMYGVPVMPVYPQPMYPVEMPYGGYQADDEPPYDDFAAMAAKRGYDASDEGHYLSDTDLPPTKVQPPKLTIPEKPEYPAPPPSRKE